MERLCPSQIASTPFTDCCNEHIISFLDHISSGCIFVEGTNQFGMSFIWFTLFCFSVSFIMTWLYMNTGGNWIVSGLLQHYIINSFAINGAVKVGPVCRFPLALQY